MSSNEITIVAFRGIDTNAKEKGALPLFRSLKSWAQVNLGSPNLYAFHHYVDQWTMTGRLRDILGNDFIRADSGQDRLELYYIKEVNKPNLGSPSQQNREEKIFFELIESSSEWLSIFPGSVLMVGINYVGTSVSDEDRLAAKDILVD